jgi:hypothetical protein
MAKTALIMAPLHFVVANLDMLDPVNWQIKDESFYSDVMIEESG